MKPRKITVLVMLLGLLLLAFAAGVAQTPAQGDQKKKAEACCCSGDSCSMKEDAKADCCKGDSCKMHKKDMNHADDHECCSCCADSCDMKHDMKDHKADCCKAKAKDAKDKNKQ